MNRTIKFRYNVIPVDVAANGHAPEYIRLSVRAAELTRELYVLQAKYTGLSRDLMTHLTYGSPPQVNALYEGTAPITHGEHALVIRQLSDDVTDVANEIATYDGELAKVQARLADLEIEK